MRLSPVHLRVVRAQNTKHPNLPWFSPTLSNGSKSAAPSVTVFLSFSQLQGNKKKNVTGGRWHFAIHNPWPPYLSDRKLSSSTNLRASLLSRQPPLVHFTHHLSSLDHVEPACPVLCLYRKFFFFCGENPRAGWRNSISAACIHAGQPTSKTSPCEDQRHVTNLANTTQSERRAVERLQM